MLAQGEYTYGATLNRSASFTGSAIVPFNISSNTAGSQDLLCTWARLKVWIQSQATSTMMTVAVGKTAPGESAPSWTSGNIQALRDEGRLFYLKTVWQPAQSVAGAKEFQLEFFNVKLRIGEALQVWLISRDTLTDVDYGYVLEKRELTVGV